jgi:hypothetical protein
MDLQEPRCGKTSSSSSRASKGVVSSTSLTRLGKFGLEAADRAPGGVCDAVVLYRGLLDEAGLSADKVLARCRVNGSSDGKFKCPFRWGLIRALIWVLDGPASRRRFVLDNDLVAV